MLSPGLYQILFNSSRRSIGISCIYDQHKVFVKAELFTDPGGGGGGGGGGGHSGTEGVAYDRYQHLKIPPVKH